jgi:phenylalanyl-tRNA synthetase alpha chain
MRWNESYFPFTDPSLELEIYFNGKWMEMLGCGIIHRDLMSSCGRNMD